MTRFGYVDTSRGQVHFREAGTGPAVVLLHWTPGTSAQYSAVAQAFAASGFRAIAPDLPGFGHSLRRAGHWSIGDFAANLIECLDGWGLERVLLVGGHLAAEISIETTLRAPARVGLAVLDGTPVWDEALRTAIVDKATPTPIEVREDGGHLADLWAQVWSGVRTWRPNSAFSPELGAYAMQLFKARILADFDMRPARALRDYDIFAGLEGLGRSAVPVLALTATDDPLHGCHAAVLARVAGSTGHCFPGEHPLHRAAGATGYVAPIVARWRALDGEERRHGASH